MHSYQEPKSPRESHPSTRRREPQAGAGQANGPALLRFGWTISDNGLLCQPVYRSTGRPEVGFQADLHVASIWGEDFFINRCPSINFGTMSLSNRRRGQ